MNEKQVAELQVGDTVYFTTVAYGFTIKAVICHEHLPDRLRKGYTAVKIVRPFEKSFVRIRTKRLFTSPEAAQVAARMKQNG